MASGSVEDEGQVAHAGITGTNYLFAMTDQAPTLWTYSPSRGATAVVSAGYLVFSFSAEGQASKQELAALGGHRRGARRNSQTARHRPTGTGPWVAALRSWPGGALPGEHRVGSGVAGGGRR